MWRFGGNRFSGAGGESDVKGILEVVWRASDHYYVTGAGGETEAVYTWNGSLRFWNIVAGGQLIGKIVPGPTRYYYLKDHLGSIRVTVKQDNTIAGWDDYYPFGMVMAGRSGNSGQADTKYKFTEKERDVETGYDYFGARYYDARIARWTSVDPLSAKSAGLTPFHYTRNNPVILVDPDGREELAARQYARDNLLNKKYKEGLNYLGGGSWSISNEDQMVCNEFIARAYAGAGYNDFPAEMNLQVKWFTDRGWFTSNSNSGERGDVMFFGDVETQGERHEMMIADFVDEGGQRKYQIMQSGLSGSKDYSQLYPKRFYTAEELGKVFAGRKEFFGIGSVQKVQAVGSEDASSSWRAIAKQLLGMGKSAWEIWVNTMLSR